MLANMLKSFLPDDFDMEASIDQAKQFMADTRAIAEGVKRIEKKIDSEVVTLRSEVAALTHKVATLQPTSGDCNDDGSGDNGATAGDGSATRILAGSRSGDTIGASGG